MIVELPLSEERKAMLSKHAERFPEAYHFTVPGDGGKPDTLTLLLGVPAKDSIAWATAVGATFRPKSVTSDNALFVMDCLLWPDTATWGGITQRWPALVESVAKAVRNKLGGALANIETPGDKETAPDVIATALAANKATTWRRLKIDATTVIDIAVKPPEQVAWQMFHDQMTVEGAAYWKLALDFATASLTACSMNAGTMFTRWPGTALLIALTASNLAGLAAEYEKGEF